MVILKGTRSKRRIEKFVFVTILIYFKSTFLRSLLGGKYKYRSTLIEN